MIKAKNSVVSLEGTHKDLIMDFNLIIADMLKVHPEIVGGVLASWASVVQEATKKADIDIITLNMHLSDTIRELTWDDKDE